MRWNLEGLRIDIGGEDGNVFVILSKIQTYIRRNYSAEEASTFRSVVTGQNMDQLGIEWTYEDVLEHCIDSTNIEFVSQYKLSSIDEKLYTVIPPSRQL